MCLEQLQWDISVKEQRIKREEKLINEQMSYLNKIKVDEEKKIHENESDENTLNNL